jgi:hypothetical protein
MIKLKNIRNMMNEPTEQDKKLFSLIDKFVELYDQKAGNSEWYGLQDKLYKETAMESMYYEILCTADVHKAMEEEDGVIFTKFCKDISIEDIRSIYIAGMMAARGYSLNVILNAARKQARISKK